MVLTIRAARVNRGLRQCDVAREMGISTATYQRFEHDPGSMRISQAIGLAEILGISISDVFAAYDSISDVVQCEANPS